MQPQSTSSRISPRRLAALASVTALTLAVAPSAGNGHLSPHLSAPGAGPSALSRSSAHGPCMISSTRDVHLSEGIPTIAGYAPSTGTVRALTLMVDFSDAPGEGKALDRYREFFPQTQQWFRTSSYGRLDYRPEIPIPGWLRMPKSFREYGIERGAPFDPGYRKLVDDLVAAADPKVDFRSYDLVNVLITPNAGPSALDTVLSVTFAGNAEAPTADGVPVANASFVYSRQDDGSGSLDRTGYRVLPHENSHVFGLPDLYTAEGGGAVGHWDIMSEDWGANNDLLGWHKWKMGWLDARQVHCATGTGTREYTLTPLAEPGARSSSSSRWTRIPDTPSSSAPAPATTRRCAGPASSSTRWTRTSTPAWDRSRSTTPAGKAAVAPAAPTSTRNSPTPPSPPARRSSTARRESASRSWSRPPRTQPRPPTRTPARTRERRSTACRSPGPEPSSEALANARPGGWKLASAVGKQTAWEGSRQQTGTVPSGPGGDHAPFLAEEGPCLREQVLRSGHTRSRNA